MTTEFSILGYALVAFLLYFFFSGLIWGAGYEFTPRKQIEVAGELLKLKEGMIVYDLGSGLGDVLIFLARKYKVKCVGIEVDPLKVMLTKLRISTDKELKRLIQIKRANLLSVDLREADAIYVFLYDKTGIMKSLKAKLASDLKDDAKIASYWHPFPDCIPQVSSGRMRIYAKQSMI